MKKLLAIILSLTMLLSLAACAQTPQTTEAPTTAPQTESQTQAPTQTETPAPTEPVKPVLSWEEFLAADMHSVVTVVATVQLAAHNEENGNANLFMASEDGGYYFVYQMDVAKEDVKKMAEGAVMRITGRKTEWSGELEIAEATYSFEQGGKSYMAEPVLLNGLMQDENLKDYNNARVRFTNVIIAPSESAEGEEQPFLYQWNGSGTEGDDIYFKAAIGDEIYTFVVESDECGPGTDLYKRVQSLEIGEIVDLEGFLYWYEGPQPHICGVKTASALKKSEGAMTHEEYREAEIDSDVVIDAYVQQLSYNETDGYMNLFLMDLDGAYYAYRMNVEADQAEKIKLGTRLKVSGIKIAWSGEVEISDGKYEILDDCFIAPCLDASLFINDAEALERIMNARILLEGAVVAPSIDADAKEQPFLYKWNGSGTEGDDIYFNIVYGANLLTVTVESDECGAETEVYKAVQQLKVGDVIDIKAFLYWYEGPQPHVYEVNKSDAPVARGMSYEEYLNAKADEPVDVTAYIQGFYYNEESGKANLYLAAPGNMVTSMPGAYFVYDMPVEKEDAGKFVVGAPLYVKGFKTEWAGLPEIKDAEYSFEGSGQYISEPDDISPLFFLDFTDVLESKIASRIALANAIVVPSLDAEEKEQPFLYKWNGSGAPGSNDDLYFTVLVAGHKLTVTVESSENPEGSEVYEAVTKLELGDIVNLEGFLYWYEGPQPHIYGVETVNPEKAMGYGKYLLAQKDEPVTVEGTITAVGAYSEEKGINLYLSDEVGSYYIYNMPIGDAKPEDFTYGTGLRVSGFKGEWAGMPEVVEAESFEFDEDLMLPLTGNRNISGILDNEEALRFYIGSTIELSDAYVCGIENEAGEKQPFLYKWNGSGEDGDDIYIKLNVDGREITCVVETDEVDPEGDTYAAVKELKLYDVIDAEALLYWYEGPQPHINALLKVHTKEEGAATYFDYLAAEAETPLTIDAYLQKCFLVEKDGELLANLFLHDRIGAYYVYGMKLESREEAAKLEVGRRMLIKGFRGEWSGEIELQDVEEYKIIGVEDQDFYHANAVDITDRVAEGQDLTALMNAYVMLRNVTIVPSKDAEGKEHAFLYKWNGSGQDGDDLYFTVKAGDVEMTLTMETDEVPAGSEAYEALKKLEVGDVVSLLAYLYWYEGPQPHVQIVVKTK